VEAIPTQEKEIFNLDIKPQTKLLGEEIKNAY